MAMAGHGRFRREPMDTTLVAVSVSLSRKAQLNEPSRRLTSASILAPSAAPRRSERASSWRPLDRDFGPPFGEDRRLLRATKPS